MKTTLNWMYVIGMMTIVASAMYMVAVFGMIALGSFVSWTFLFATLPILGMIRICIALGLITGFFYVFSKEGQAELNALENK